MTEPRPINTTSDLTPDGIIFGYAKGIAAAITVAVETATPLLPEDLQVWARLVVALLGAVAVVLAPNRFERLHVVAPSEP
jgi:hypothetical protein